MQNHVLLVLYANEKEHRTLARHGKVSLPLFMHVNMMRFTDFSVKGTSCLAPQITPW